MKPYKRIFKESNQTNLIVSSKSEASKLVDISNLKWSDTYGGVMGFTYMEAINKCPFGWRLPTVQQLYTAYVKINEDFIGLPVFPVSFKQDYYWSASISDRDSNYAWYLDFLSGEPDSYNKTNGCFVCYVK